MYVRKKRPGRFKRPAPNVWPNLRKQCFGRTCRAGHFAQDISYWSNTKTKILHEMSGVQKRVGPGLYTGAYQSTYHGAPLCSLFLEHVPRRWDISGGHPPGDLAVRKQTPSRPDRGREELQRGGISVATNLSRVGFHEHPLDHWKETDSRVLTETVRCTGKVYPKCS